jgi:RNA polymerase sigma factor (sigma-70 family)
MNLVDELTQTSNVAANAGQSDVPAVIMQTGMGRDSLIPTRHSLLRRLKDHGDDRSWEDFFATYSKLIYNVSVKAGLTHAEAQDVVQETVMTVAKKIKDFQVDAARGSFKAWLLQTTRWRIADQFRKRPPAAAHDNASPDETSRTPTAERIPDPASLNLDAVWDQDWRQNLTEAAMARLKSQVDPEQYQIFDLHVLKQWPAAKVAEKMDVKLAQVYFAKYKVSRLLKKEIKRLETRLI